MATATWFDYNAYMANKLVQVNAIDPKVQYTPETLKAEFEKAGYVGEEGAFKHFEQYGKTEDVAPNALFDADEYITAKAADFFKTDKPTASNIAEVAKAFADGGMSAWDHYVTYGSSEGVEPSFSFNTDAYLAAKAAALNAGKYDGKENWTAEDVAAAIKASGSTVLEHFMANGGGGKLEVGVSYKGVTADGVKNPFIDNNPPVPVPDPNPGDTYPLTTKVDTFTGKEKDDVFTGMSSYLSDKTLNEGDQIDGGEGIDTLKVEMKSSFAGFTGEGKMVNVENVDLTHAGNTPMVFNAKGITGADTYTLHSTKGSISLSNLDATGITVNVDGLKSGSTSIGFASKVADGDADELGLGLNNVGTVKADKIAEAKVEVTAAGIEHLSINATGANVVDLAKAATESITAVGSGSLKVTKVNAGIDTFNAAGVKGDVVADLSGATLKSVQGGAGNDTFTVDNLASTASLEGGLGNDTLVLKGGGTLRPTMSGFENVRVDAGNLTMNAESAADFTSLEVTNGAVVKLSNVAAPDFTLSSIVGKSGTAQVGSVAISSANNLVYNTVAHEDTVKGKKTDSVTTTVTANEATSVTVNVGANTTTAGALNFAKAESVNVNVASAKGGADGKTEQTAFNATLTAGEAQSLIVDAKGALGATFNVANANNVSVTAAQGGTSAITAGKAKTVDITSGATFTLTGSLDEAESVKFVGEKGLFDADAVALEAINTLELSGAGIMSIGALGTDKLGYDITVNARDLASLTGTTVETGKGNNITLNVASVAGAVTFTDIGVALDGAKNSGSVTVNARNLNDSLDLGNIVAKNVTIDARGIMDDVTVGNITGDVIDFNASGAMASVTVGTLTVGSELKFTGGETNTIDIDMAGTDINAFLFGGTGDDTVTIADFMNTSDDLNLTLSGDLGDGNNTVSVDMGSLSSAANVNLDFSGLKGVDTVTVTNVDTDIVSKNFTYLGVDGSDIIHLNNIDLMNTTGKVVIDLIANDNAADKIEFGSVVGSLDSGQAFEISGFEAGTGSDVLQFTKGLLVNGNKTELASGTDTIVSITDAMGSANLTGGIYSTYGIFKITEEVANMNSVNVWAAIAGDVETFTTDNVSTAKLLFLVENGSDTYIWYFDSADADADASDLHILGVMKGETGFTDGDIGIV